ncbi:hypothetical protein QDA03_gp22 [Microbacterium phage Terij]|uniref:Uncharacterized protein n=1 Tax=Microbacterium phage Terij TaxID=2686229 RepID=A0A6B9LIX7_9CAUD|nr:hypothetical protein QDA03_gp22 [Microbacterium phage Terij]QHB37219.1 hypothetical protein SEA_TERIJ_85 [Microbacterium phage Terij]
MSRPRAQATCTAEGGCDYRTTVGLIPGVDVSIDGDIWPGSPYDRHIQTCPADGWPSTKAHDEAERP